MYSIAIEIITTCVATATNQVETKEVLTELWLL